MSPAELAILAAAGLAGGFVGGLVGVGGGVIFAPVLFFTFVAAGVTDPVLTPLTIGSSLLGTLVTSSVSAWYQYRKQAVRVGTAVAVGLSSALAVYVMTQWVTTKPWYDATVFQAVFSVLLLIVGARMLMRPPSIGTAGAAPGESPAWPALVGIGSAAGAVSTAVGVGGGIVLVPAFHHGLRLPIHEAVGTSSAAIVLIASAGVFAYALAGLGEPVPATAVGYVDVASAAALALPAAIAARLGVSVAHRFNTVWLRRSFAILAVLVAIRLIIRAF